MSQVNGDRPVVLHFFGPLWYRLTNVFTTRGGRVQDSWELLCGFESDARFGVGTGWSLGCLTGPVDSDPLIKTIFYFTHITKQQTLYIFVLWSIPVQVDLVTLPALTPRSAWESFVHQQKQAKTLVLSFWVDLSLEGIKSSGLW